MRILWLCNICPPAVALALGQRYSVREGWLTGALNRFLAEQEAEMELAVCFPAEGELAAYQKKTVLRELSEKAEDGGTPSGEKEVMVYGFRENLKRPEIYDRCMEKRFAEILADFKPDLVHIFGTEFPHALAMVRSFGKPERILVGIQGLVGECAESYMADLPLPVQKRATFRDRIRKDSLRQQQEKFRIRGERERLVLQGSAHVTGRTEFDRLGSLACNPRLIYHKMNETMRSCFYEGKWKRGQCRSYEIFASQGDYPLKGFHYLLRAMPEILEKFPAAHVSVAGNRITAYGSRKEKLKISGYGKYLRDIIQENGLADRVSVLGQLSDRQMKEAYLGSHVFVCPSALENSPNSLGEAMLLGLPCIAARTGGIPDMAEDGKSALFFEKGDIRGLAQSVIRVFEEDSLAQELSEAARERAFRNHDGNENYRRLMEIYHEILQDWLHIV